MFNVDYDHFVLFCFVCLVLYCLVLYCLVLYCIVLFCFVLKPCYSSDKHSTEYISLFSLFSLSLSCSCYRKRLFVPMFNVDYDHFVLFCFVCLVLSCIALSCLVLSCFVLFCFVLFCSVCFVLLQLMVEVVFC
jgi:hypothetical protein